MDDVSIVTLSPEGLTDKNLFAYCGNNPVNLSDLDGNWPSWASKIAIGIGAIVIGAAVVAATAATGGVAAAFIGAAVSGLKAAVISGAIGAVVDASTSAVSHRISTGSWSGAGKAALKLLTAFPCRSYRLVSMKFNNTFLLHPFSSVF